MKSNYANISTLADELMRLDSRKNDYIPSTNQMEMTGDGKELIINQIGGFEISPLCHNQIADRLKIPRKYYDAIATVPGLRAQNVNGWFKSSPERRMVRTVDDHARAFLSDRYKPIDHMFVISPFLQALKDFRNKSGGEFAMKTTALTDRRMYIEIMFPNITGEIVSTGRGTEKVNAGIALTNSEVGLGAFDVSTFIWWQWCENGAIAQKHLRKYHTGRRVGDDESDYVIYSDETIKKEMDAFQSRLGDIFKYAMTEESFSEIVDKIQATTGRKVEKPTNLIQNVTKRFQLTAEQGDRILSNMVEEGNMNQYGLMNGITRLAQEVEDIDSGFELEKLGASIMDLPKSDWTILSEGKVA